MAACSAIGIWPPPDGQNPYPTRHQDRQPCSQDDTGQSNAYRATQLTEESRGRRGGAQIRSLHRVLDRGGQIGE
jgi:hypothetical protein